MTVLPVLYYIFWSHIYRKSIIKEIYYYDSYIIGLSLSNKEIVIKYSDITKTKPLIKYGKTRVPDYMLFFKKPFPPVSRFHTFQTASTGTERPRTTPKEGFSNERKGRFPYPLLL